MLIKQIYFLQFNLFSEGTDTKQIIEQQVILKKSSEGAGIEPGTSWSRA